MELDELITKLINHIDETAARTETEIIREVNVLLEHQRDTIIKFADTRADKKVSELDKEVELQAKRVK